MEVCWAAEQPHVRNSWSKAAAGQAEKLLQARQDPSFGAVVFLLPGNSLPWFLLLLNPSPEKSLP